jgi:hypothetical protein
MIHLESFLRNQISCAATVLAALISGCSVSDAPLTITLHNPNTGVQRTCAAKGSSSKDISALSDAVEACAKQLETHGFVRSD